VRHRRSRIITWLPRTRSTPQDLKPPRLANEWFTDETTRAPYIGDAARFHEPTASVTAEVGFDQLDIEEIQVLFVYWARESP
jgi:hypothetical protein